MNEYKIETREAIALMVNLLCNKLFVLAPLYLKVTAKNTVLITIIILYLTAFIVWKICTRLNTINNDLLDTIPISSLKTILGSIIGITITIVTILSLRQYAEGIKVMTLQKTPIKLIIAIFAISMIFGAFCGLKSISKSNSFFVPIIYSIALFLVFATLKGNDLYNIFPILGDGINVILTKSLIMLSMLFELLILFMLPPFLKRSEDYKKVGNYAFLWSGICFLSIGGIYSLASPLYNSTQSYEPFFRLIKQIEIGNFLQRFDSFFLILYCMSAFLYLSAMLFFATHIFAKTFRINSKKNLIFPIGLIITSSSAVGFLEEYMFYIVEKSNYILWVIAFAVPLSILLISKLRSSQ